MKDWLLMCGTARSGQQDSIRMNKKFFFGKDNCKDFAVIFFIGIVAFNKRYLAREGEIII